MSEAQNDLIIFATWIQILLFVGPALICAVKLEVDERAEQHRDLFHDWHWWWNVQPAH